MGFLASFTTRWQRQVTLVVIGLVPVVAGGAMMVQRSYQSRHDAATDQVQAQAGEAAYTIQELFREWQHILQVAANNQQFSDWYVDGESPELRATIERSLLQLHELYPDLIDEACFIDRGGQELARQMGGAVSPVEELSADESEASFFEPTFALRGDAVHQNAPYVSADSRRWVISNSTPLESGSQVTALLHFEASLEGLRDRLSNYIAPGLRMRVIDESGSVVIDTADASPIEAEEFARTDRPQGLRSMADVQVGSTNENRWTVEVTRGSVALVDRVTLLILGLLLVATAGALIFGGRRIASSLAAPAQQIRDVSDGISVMASELAHASEAASGDLEHIALATSQLASSAGEIAGTAHDLARNAESASRLVGDAVSRIGHLNEVVGNVGSVVELIEKIAESTNLLALNATIEAARAGTAGKGFAVVANEVKALAGQVSQATTVIVGQLAEVDHATTAASEVVRRVDGVMSSLDELQLLLASASEEQVASTRDISLAVDRALDAVRGIAQRSGSEGGGLATVVEELSRSADSFST